MTTVSTQPQNWNLEDLALQYGPVELQRPLDRSAFMALAAHFPNLQIEREPNGITTIMSR